MSEPKAIAVYAASSPEVAPVYVTAARALGRALALRGYRLVNGGGARGLMGATIDGCLEAGGLCTGVIPRFMHDKGWGHKGLSQTVVARDMHHRKATMAAMAPRGVIALPGGVGTLEEILEIITWRKLGLYTGKAVLCNTAGFYDPLIAMLQRIHSENFAQGEPLYLVAATADEAVSLIADD